MLTTLHYHYSNHPYRQELQFNICILHSIIHLTLPLHCYLAYTFTSTSKAKKLAVSGNENRALQKNQYAARYVMPMLVYTQSRLESTRCTMVPKAHSLAHAPIFRPPCKLRSRSMESHRGTFKERQEKGEQTRSPTPTATNQERKGKCANKNCKN